MSLPLVDAVIVGAGAGGPIVARQLTQAGWRVVLLERGKWNTPHDDLKDDLRNQRNSTLGNPFGPADEGNPRVVVDLDGSTRIVAPWEPGYSNNAGCVGGGTFSYGAMAWRYQPNDFRMASHVRRAGGLHARRLARFLRGPGALLRAGRVGAGRLRRRLEQPVQRPAP